MGRFLLVDEDGIALPNSEDLIKLNNGNIEITNANLLETVRTVQLKAVTKGGVEALRKIEL